MTHPLKQPSILDPNRALGNDRDELTLEEHRSRKEELELALKETCAYGQQLWNDIARARQYLYDSLPPDPRMPDADRVGATPTGPDDEEGWQHWIDAYAELTSVLSGPHGDSGFGVSEARRAAALRREAPPARLRAAEQAGELKAARETAQLRQGDGATRTASAEAPAARHVETSARQTPARVAALGALLILALRGLRPRRPRA